MIYSVSEWEHKENKRRINELEEKGYIFKVSSDGYQVWFKSEYLGGAGVIEPRKSKTRRTMERKQADYKNYTESALRCAERHEAQAAKNRLAYLRGEIESEHISYAEIAELQDLARFIDPSDTLLLEWAGVEEDHEL